MKLKKLDTTKRTIMMLELQQAREAIDIAWKTVKGEEGRFDEAQMCFGLWYMINEVINLLGKVADYEKTCI